MQWSEKWLLKFNPDICKVMRIGHDLPTRYMYATREGDMKIELESTGEVKDLGAFITKDLKCHEQHVQSAKKAQSVLGMVKRHFKKTDKDDFKALYNTYIRPHLEYCIHAWSPHLKKDIDCLERIQRRVTTLVDELKKRTYEERLKVLGIYSRQ